jgi:hypothetical protein
LPAYTKFPLLAEFEEEFMEFKKPKKHQKVADGEPAHLWCHWVWPYEKIDHTVMLFMSLMLLLVQSWRRRNGSRKTRRSTR